jgi:hypothetical protein
MNMTIASRIRIARFIAVGADVLQLGLFPLFAEGFISPLDDALDVLVCVLLTWLVGWHYSFLPSVVIKVLPVADLVPTWTIAVFLATRQKRDLKQTGTTQVYVEPPSQLNSPPHQSR